uniref:Uncharacterized protein n=1 Tax=Arundo donax TaxID=35708 RepID=A0A0A8XX22_ARUDO
MAAKMCALPGIPLGLALLCRLARLWPRMEPLWNAICLTHRQCRLPWA